MSEVTRILAALDAGDAHVASKLLPLVYEELRNLAAAQMTRETPGQTLQPTALVHEAYIRLVGSDDQPRWRGRTHFFSAAAESMRRILIDAARRRHAAKRGGGNNRADIDPDHLASSGASDELLALDEALERLAKHAPQKAELVKLRYFAGCTLDEAAELLGISPREADRAWAYAKTWLKVEIGTDRDPQTEK
jgi:RNA polymerase sigma factor (TIGR02999 family)